MFQVICVLTGEAVKLHPHDDSKSDLRLFESGAEAAMVAVSMTDSFGLLYQVRPFIIDATAWRDREQTRFDSGQYVPCVWASESWFKDSALARDHFAHVSQKNPGSLAYTESDIKGAQDLQTPIRAGRYLQTYFAGALDSREIQTWASAHAAKHESCEVLFARTADEIESVFTTGEQNEDGQHSPASCMSYDTDRFDSCEHPVRAYAGPDLAIAYVKRAHRIVSRVVCWPDKKRYSRIYGDSTLLLAGLESMGFESGSLSGARMTAIENGDGTYVCPYIDFIASVGLSDCESYLLIGRGDISCTNTNGCTDEAESFSWHCERCEAGQGDYDSGITLEDSGEIWCESCAEYYGIQCDRSGGWFASRDNMVEMSNGQLWAMRVFEDDGTSCERCDSNIHIDDSESVDDETLCEDCAVEAREEIEAREESDALAAIDSKAESRPSGYLGNGDSYRVAYFDRLNGRRLGVAMLDESATGEAQTVTHCRAIAEARSAAFNNEGGRFRYMVESVAGVFTGVLLFEVRRYNMATGENRGTCTLRMGVGAVDITATPNHDEANAFASRFNAGQYGRENRYVVAQCGTAAKRIDFTNRDLFADESESAATAA